VRHGEPLKGFQDMAELGALRLDAPVTMAAPSLPLLRPM
jgi:hypothetical protein